MHASSTNLSGIGLDTLRAEYIHMYNRLLDREKQPHSDFFVNLCTVSLSVFEGLE